MRTRSISFEQAGQIAADLTQRNNVLIGVEVTITVADPVDREPISMVYRYGASDLDAALAAITDRARYSA